MCMYRVMRMLIMLCRYVASLGDVWPSYSQTYTHIHVTHIHSRAGHTQLSHSHARAPWLVGHGRSLVWVETKTEMCAVLAWQVDRVHIAKTGLILQPAVQAGLHAWSVLRSNVLEQRPASRYSLIYTYIYVYSYTYTWSCIYEYIYIVSLHCCHDCYIIMIYVAIISWYRSHHHWNITKSS